MVSQNEFENKGYRWMFSGALATNVLCLAILGFLHKNLDMNGAARIPRSIRLGARLAAALIIALLPLSSALNETIKTLAVCAGTLLALVIFEMYGKLGSIGAGWEDMTAEEVVEEEKYEEELAVAQADPSFNNDFVSESHMEEGGAERPQTTTLTEKDGQLAPPSGPRQRKISATSSGKKKKNALEEAREKARLEKAARWTAELHTLTENERGEDDVGMEEELGNIEVREIAPEQRWAYAA